MEIPSNTPEGQQEFARLSPGEQNLIVEAQHEEALEVNERYDRGEFAAQPPDPDEEILKVQQLLLGEIDTRRAAELSQRINPPKVDPAADATLAQEIIDTVPDNERLAVITYLNEAISAILPFRDGDQQIDFPEKMSDPVIMRMLGSYMKKPEIYFHLPGHSNMYKGLQIAKVGWQSLMLYQSDANECFHLRFIPNEEMQNV